MKKKVQKKCPGKMKIYFYVNFVIKVQKAGIIFVYAEIVLNPHDTPT